MNNYNLDVTFNLNNEVFGFYNGSQQYPIQREYYWPTYTFGLLDAERRSRERLPSVGEHSSEWLKNEKREEIAYAQCRKIGGTFTCLKSGTGPGAEDWNYQH